MSSSKTGFKLVPRVIVMDLICFNTKALRKMPDVNHGRPFVEKLDVYKVGDKVFMIVTDDPDEPIITLKADPQQAQALPARCGRTIQDDHFPACGRSKTLKERNQAMTQQSRKTQALADHYVDQLSSWAKITTRPLFGAVAFYRHDQVFAMVWHGGLYFKVDDDSRKDYETAGSHALGYVSEGDKHALKSYWEVPADVTEDREQLQQWAERAYHAAVKSAKD